MANEDVNEPTPWGADETKFFFELGPENILNAVELSGIKCTGRVLTLNSMENRVYEVEIVLPQGYRPKSPSERFRVVKFYRPGRWSREQILEEHKFLFDLEEYEIPVVAPLRFEDGSSLAKMEKIEIWFAVFPKMGGRSPDELDDNALLRVGRLLGRMHGSGRAGVANHRIKLTPQTYGLNNLAYLTSAKILPPEIESSYRSMVEEICRISTPWFEEVTPQRIHGDCHLGNLLWNDRGPFWVDFDDMLLGPPIQDLWLLIPGRTSEARDKFDILLESYEEMNRFERKSLKLIEVLRALRFIHFSAWISKRWQDPAFPRTFPLYGTQRYWQDQLQDLREQLELIREVERSGSNSVIWR